ncbi:MAG: UDP-N-acetylmuramate--L-alanine ligase [bacterium]|nr:UDP-N-acetylmuramate--L-alanine ligase [bacterium]
MYKTIQRVHFIGIGGIGMSGLAEILLNLGYKVSGSDLKASPIIQRLRRLGAKISTQHRAQNVEGAQVAVVSSAIPKTNPEVEEAIRQNIPVAARAEILAELMRLKYGIAIAGTHGKTTTTSLIAAVLHEGKFDPTVVVGGKVRSLRTNARLGRGEFMVAEADESDGSFLKLSPTIAVITTIDVEHMDHYKDFQEVQQTYLEFCQKIPFYGLAVLGLDDPVVRRLARRLSKRVLTYRLGGKADLTATHLKQKENKIEAIVHFHEKKLGKIRLNIPGKHNISNALAAVAVGLELGIPFKTISRALARFKGISRRLEIVGRQEKQMVLDDYGHHPTEIRATLEAIQKGWRQPVTVVFQPHRYTRTRDLLKDFCTAFKQADEVIITDIYAASEMPIQGINGENLAKQIKHPRVNYEPDFETIISRLSQKLLGEKKKERIILTLGAGDVWKIGKEIARRTFH